MKARKSRKNPDGGLGFAAGMGVGAATVGAVWFVAKALSKSAPVIAPVPVLATAQPPTLFSVPTMEPPHVAAPAQNAPTHPVPYSYR